MSAELEAMLLVAGTLVLAGGVGGGALWLLGAPSREGAADRAAIGDRYIYEAEMDMAFDEVDAEREREVEQAQELVEATADGLAEQEGFGRRHDALFEAAGQVLRDYPSEVENAVRLRLGV